MSSAESPTADPTGTAPRPRVLAVSTFFPWPVDHGDAVRRSMVLQALAESAELTAVCVDRPGTTAADEVALRAALPGATVHRLPLRRARVTSLRARVARTARGLATLTPPWVYRREAPGLEELLAQEAATGQYDVVVLVGEPAGPAAPWARRVAPRVVWDKSNVLTASDLDALRTVSSLLGRVRALTTLPLSWVFERRVLAAVDEVWVTSREEDDRLHRVFGRRSRLVLPSTVAPRSPAAGLDPTSRTLLWVSTFGYTPNWDGLLRFLDAAGGALVAGGWTLRVVGAGATPAQEARLRATPAVDYRGFVADLAEACSGVAAGVVPVWAGAGVKLKTLTLMSLGVPLLATPVALEGIGPEAAAAVPETPADFVGALAALRPEDLIAAATRAAAVLEDRFTSEAFTAGVRRGLSPPPRD